MKFFWENNQRLSVINYFQKGSMINVWQGPKCVFERYFNSPNFMELSLPSNNYIYISFGRFSGFVTED